MRSNDLNPNFARISLGGRRPVEASDAHDPTGAAGSAPPSCFGAPLEAARRTADHTLQRLKVIRHTLNGAQSAALATIERCDALRRTATSNRDVVRFTPGTIPALAEHVTLTRRPSFLLAEPVLSDIASATPSDPSALLLLPMSTADKTLLTAQVASVRLQIKTNQHEAAAQAERGERIRTMPFDRERFDGFLDRQQPLLREVIAACNVDGDERNALLEPVLAELAAAYLNDVGRLPPGHAPGIYTEMEGQIFGPQPVSVGFLPESGMADRSVIESDEGSSLIIWLKSEDVDNFLNNPEAFHDLPGWSEHVDGCSLAQQQAGVFLQNLFFALATVEETGRLEEAEQAQRRGVPLPADVRCSKANFDYEGSAMLGDDFIDGESLSKRSISGIALQMVPQRAVAYEVGQGSSPLLDEQLAAWAGSPAFDGDVVSLTKPQFRMRMAQVDVVGEALNRTGLFSAPI